MGSRSPPPGESFLAGNHSWKRLGVPGDCGQRSWPKAVPRTGNRVRTVALNPLSHAGEFGTMSRLIGIINPCLMTPKSDRRISPWVDPKSDERTQEPIDCRIQNSQIEANRPGSESQNSRNEANRPNGESQNPQNEANWPRGDCQNPRNEANWPRKPPDRQILTNRQTRPNRAQRAHRSSSQVRLDRENCLRGVLTRPRVPPPSRSGSPACQSSG